MPRAGLFIYFDTNRGKKTRGGSGDPVALDEAVACGSCISNGKD